ncbi:hypothetical protein BDP27DRAFT_1310546 [Rhodocollybia butyracea]|uniref:PAS domain-containing protein n=1 Tax=Rhodocollybia butyracea TaxID=206335 RepID=A0A9P5Q9G7_9AGAR|nr:hypothetical protein BDP27DRAFT_1310546 [Rhodocollybia butyracea]
MGNGALHPLMSRDRKVHSIPSPVVAKEFKKLMEDPTFMASFPISTITIAESQSIATSLNSGDNSDLVNVGPPGNHPLSLLLLEYAPDFIHVVSLKGTFLYVAPSVRRVLGYEPEELIGKSLSDICHPADLVPLMRELKESSATGSTALGGSGSTSGEDSSRQYHLVKPRPVDLLFRAQTKSGQYVWVECRGRLHVEPGKGRKAIMLSGRAKEMSMLQWSAILSAGGVSHPRSVIKWVTEDGKTRPVETDVFTEFWGTISRKGSLLVIGKGVVDVLGWDESHLIGRQIWKFLVGEDARRKVSEELAHMGCAMGTRDATGTLPRKIYCKMTRQDGSPVDVELVLYPSAIDSYILHSAQTISPAPVIYQIKLYDASSSTLSSSPGSESSAAPTPMIMHPLTDNVFKDLEISRNSSWQYELQQLRFANERLKEEIKAIEGDQPSPAPHKQHALSSSPQGSHEHSPTASTSHHHINRTPDTMASPAALKSYDHHLHQGMPSMPFNSPHVMTVHPSSPQYNPHVQHVPQHVQPQAWSPSSRAVSMPMPFVSPGAYDAPSSVPLKRSWDGSTRNGNRLIL